MPHPRVVNMGAGPASRPERFFQRKRVCGGDNLVPPAARQDDGAPCTCGEGDGLRQARGLDFPKHISTQIIGIRKEIVGTAQSDNATDGRVAKTRCFSVTRVKG